MPSATDPFGKTVLLLDSNQKLREMRARRLRLYGISVHTVGTVEEARARLEGNTYNLVLIAPRKNPEEVIEFHREIKRLHPTQRVVFCVGPPKYISSRCGQNAVPMPARSDTWAERLKGRLASA
ncbi:MAG TPA: response regulator [Terriglobales bacterium]|nr:response regulator [Terriglobales bacterium]